MTTQTLASDVLGHKTVRELGGEVWAKLAELPEEDLPWDVKNRVVDLVMSVLARHDGYLIRNDPDIPVEPATRS